MTRKKKKENKVESETPIEEKTAKEISEDAKEKKLTRTRIYKRRALEVNPNELEDKKENEEKENDELGKTKVIGDITKNLEELTKNKKEAKEDMAKEKGKKKTKKKKRTGLKILQGIFYTLLLLGFIGVMAACAAGVAFFLYIKSQVPEFKEDAMYTREPSIMLDSEGKQFAEIGTEDRVILSYDELPEVLVNAIVATEDSKFFQHNGIDLPRFFVASIGQVLGRSDAGGASTITMQLAKNYYNGNEASGWEGIVRKFKDIYMSVFEIEPAYSKQEILEFYVNSIPLGIAAGVEATSEAYFGKSAKDLNLAEAAMIAGLYQAPGAYNPYSNPEGTEARRKDVLYLMHRHGYISDEEYDIAAAMTVDKIVQDTASVAIGTGLGDPDYQFFRDMVIREVEEKTGTSPYSRPMTIYTTMNTKAQKHVSDIMFGKTYKWQNKKVQAGVAVVDLNTGAIAAVGGGRKVTGAMELNRATDIERQIGSTAKPLYDYGPAIEYLNWNTGTLLDDSKTTYSDGTPVTNWDGKYKGVNTIEYQLKVSRNIPALKTFKAVGREKIANFVSKLGLNPEAYYCNAGYTRERNKCINKSNPSDVSDAMLIPDNLHEAHAIGGYNGENPLSMAAAYAAFGNGGYYNEPYSFTKIVYEDTGEVYINSAKSNQVMQDSTAYIITHMLQETASYGIDAGSYRSINGIKYAAKTGTSNFDVKTIKANKLASNAVNDYWVAGYNTEYAVAVWYGYDKIQDGYNRLGSSQHQRLFQAVAKGVFKSKADFTMPSSVVKVTVETDSAVPLLPSANTPSKYKKSYYFVAGSEPDAASTSTRFKKLDDISNLTASDNGDGTATISWSPIATPDALNLDYITNLNANSSLGSDAASYSKSVLKKNQSLFGSLGYNVYVKNSSGNLELKGWTASNSYTITGSGTMEVVVRSCYSKYTSLMSNGKSINVTIASSPSVPLEPGPVVPGE